MMRFAPLFLLVVAAAPRGETTYYFGANEARTNISFEGRTDIATISGVSHRASGHVAVDFEAGTGSCAISVPVASMNTGMDARDRVMRSKDWLDAEKFPDIEFKSEKGTLTTKPSTWTVEGKFTMHGVSKALTVAVEVKAIPDDLAKKAKLGAGSWVRVRTSFKVKLSDHGIKVPDRSVATVDDTWSVTIDVFGTTEKPPDLKTETKPDDEPDPASAIKPSPVTLEGVEGTRYKFGGKLQFTNVRLVSESETEPLAASTNIMAGLAAMDFAEGTGKVKLSLPVAGFKTGIDKRDEEFRGATGLDGAKHPDILFETTKLARKSGGKWTLEATLTMRGKSVAISAEAGLAELPQDLVKASGWGNKPGLKLVATFALKLSEFGITLRDGVTLTVDLIALKE